MSNPFDIQIPNQPSRETYRLQGYFTMECGVIKSVTINDRGNTWCGDGGSIDNPLSKISLFIIEDLFKEDIENAIHQHIKDGL